MRIIGDFKVTVLKMEVVTAAQTMEEHFLPQSNLDLLLPPVDVGVFFCYTKPPVISDYLNFGTMVGSLKKALSETLVTYYTFSGEMVQNLAGEAELFCNNGGVKFTEAFADIELQQLDLHNPDKSIEGKLVPKKMHGVLAIQATELICGGIVIGCTFDHRVADAYSANMFLVSWAEIAQSKPITMYPSFLRSAFSPRRPGHYDQSVHNMYMLFPKAPPPLQVDHLITEVDVINKVPVSRIYYIKADQVHQLQLLASTGKSVTKRSKLEAFSAFLWKMIVKNTIKNGEKSSRLGIVVDGRTRLCSRDINQEKLMCSYFGNVLSIPFGEKSINELNDMPLNLIANEVHKIIKMAADEEHFLGLVDYVEAHRPQQLVSKIYTEKTNSEDHETTFVVSSGLHFPVRKMDFGWGKSVFGSYHFPWGGHAGYVMPMPSASGNGDWIVYIHLHAEEIKTLLKNVSHVFKPFTLLEYMG